MKKVYYLLLGLISHSVWAESKPAPALHALSIETQQAIDLNQYQGKVVYLDFWASWCPPCAQSFPALNALYQELNPQGFEIIAVSVDKKLKDLQAFITKIPVDFTLAWDADGVSPERYQVQTMPSGFLIDKQGHLRHRIQGFREGHIEKIKQQLMGLLEE